MPNLVSDGAEFSCNFCTTKLKLKVTNSSSTGDSQKLANQTNCFLPPPGGNCTFPPGVPPPPCAGVPPGMVVETGQTTVKVDGQTALGEGSKFMCPLFAQPVTLSKAGQEVAKNDEASTALDVASLVADFIPIVQTVKSFIELATGVDPVNHKKVSRKSAMVGLIPGGKILTKGKKVAKVYKKLHTKITKKGSKALPKKAKLKGANDNNAHKIPPLSKSKQKEYKAKQKNRSLKKEEYKKLDREKRFTKRRKEGVREFWDEEQKKLHNNEKPSRDWTSKQREDILNGKRPKDATGKTIEGHHKYSAREYPQHANDKRNIEPLTRDEHRAAHSGDFRNPTHGESLKQVRN